MLKSRQDTINTTPTKASHLINVYNHDSPQKSSNVFGTPIEIIPSKIFKS